MSARDMVLENINRAPSWPTLHSEVALLLVDLWNDPKYGERVKHISSLLDDPRFPRVEQIYFVPK
jgi:hypothetical protein